MQKVRHKLFFSVFGLAITGGAVTQAQVYRWVDENGILHFSDSAPGQSGDDGQSEVVTISEANAFSLGEAFSENSIAASRQSSDSDSGFSPAADASTAFSDEVNSCAVPSPMVAGGRDLYEVAESPPMLTSVEIEALTTFLDDLEGRWSGEGTGFDCEESNGKRSMRSFSQDIRADIRFGVSDLLSIESRISSGKTNWTETLRIGLRDGALWVNGGGASLIEVSESAASIGYRDRAGGTITERYWDLRLAGRSTLQVDMAVFGNGHLVSSASRVLNKPF